MKHLTAEWIEKAEEDFLSASHLAAAEKLTPHNVTCFLCQQAGEKWLKARLCEDDLPFQKMHDLRQLLVLLKDAYPEWIALMDQARRLSFYSVSTRYPGTVQVARIWSRRWWTWGLSATSFAPRLACSSQNER